MKVYYKEGKDIRDIVLDFSDSQFSADELIKQIAQRIRDNQAIHSLMIENAEFNDKGMNAFRHALLGHQALRKLSLKNILISSYPFSTHDEYFFPQDLDNAVEHLCAILRDARLNEIEITHLTFRDRTEHHYEHFDMVDPAVMRDLLLQEKQPYYVSEIANSLCHNPHLLTLILSIVECDTDKIVSEVEAVIKKRQSAECLNEILQGTHATAETHLPTEIFKFFTAIAWINNLMKKKRM
jgi:hypothetical protein